jgi:hypothetical protein
MVSARSGMLLTGMFRAFQWARKDHLRCVFEREGHVAEKYLAVPSYRPQFSTIHETLS